MSTPESKVKKRVKALLDKHHAWHNWPVPMGYGVPMLDCVGCHRGRFFAIETKAAGETLTPRQEFTKSQMEEAGARVFVVTGSNNERDPDTWQGWSELTLWLIEGDDSYADRDE